MQKLTTQYPALRSGTQQLRYAERGSFAVSRYGNKQEFLVAFNGRDQEAKLEVPVSTKSSKWSLISGSASGVSSSDKSVSFTLPPRNWAVLKADTEFAPSNQLAITINKPAIDKRTTDQLVALTASIPGTDFNEVTFAVRSPGKPWQIVGTSDHRTFGASGFKDGLYRVYLHQSKYKSKNNKEIKLEVIAVVANANGEKIASGIQSYLIK